MGGGWFPNDDLGVLGSDMENKDIGMEEINKSGDLVVKVKGKVYRQHPCH